MTEKVFYKALASCRLGGAYRKAGEVFPLPRFEVCPGYLQEVGEEKAALEPPKTRKPKAQPPGPMPADLPGVIRDEPARDIPMMEESPTSPRPEKTPAASPPGVQGEALVRG
jgi:hypothetical protein